VKTAITSEDLLPTQDGFVRRGSIQTLYQRKYSDGNIMWFAVFNGMSDDSEKLPQWVQSDADVVRWWRDVH
jgi:hypothetical protein